MNKIEWGILLAVGAYVGCSGKLNIDSDSSRGGASGAGAGAGAASGSAAGGYAGTLVNAGGSAGHETGGTGATGGDIGEAGTGNEGGGDLGGPCIPSTTTLEAQGTPGETNVVTLERCHDGLSCDAGSCVPSPQCPATVGGRCIVRDGSVPATSQQLSPLTLDATHVYWAEYGTRDSLGNHKHDGSIKAYDLATGAVTTIATGFDGAIAVFVTSTHAYVTVDGAPLAGLPPHFVLWRVPLAGGTSELVSDPLQLCQDCFASVADRAYIADVNGIDTLDDNSGVGAFYGGEVSRGLIVSDDGQTLFTTSGDILEINLSNAMYLGSIPQAPVGSYLPHGDSMYGLERIGDLNPSLVLDKVAIAGGSWQRVRALGAGAWDGSYLSLKIVGDHYFVGEDIGATYPHDPAVLAASVSSPSSAPVRVLQEKEGPPLYWVVAPQGIFWTDGTSIYSQLIDALP